MSCKDIRTYCANTIFKREYSKLIKSGINVKKARIEATKITANELGNTPKVCRDSYIDPMLYSEWINWGMNNLNELLRLK